MEGDGPPSPFFADPDPPRDGTPQLPALCGVRKAGRNEIFLIDGSAALLFDPTWPIGVFNRPWPKDTHMQKHLDLTRQRIVRYAAKIPARFYPERKPVMLSAYAAPGRIAYAEACKGGFSSIEIGRKFGPLWSTHWVKVTDSIPAEWQGKEVHFRWDSSSEGCVWQNGAPAQGLTGSSGNGNEGPVRAEYRLTSSARGGEPVELYVEVACNALLGVNIEQPDNSIGTLLMAEIAVFDRAAWDLYWDFAVVAEMASHLSARTPRGGQALRAGNEMVNALRLDDRSTWKTVREVARKFLSARNGGGQHNLSAIGHAHIDTAWLWPLAETRRKCARTFASAVRYMDEYPAYKFAASQAQQYAWMKEQYAVLFERIKAKVAGGQFVPVGGTWVEPDCNIPSGESLVRQFLYGQRFFQREFGVTCTEFWNPDVFGYSGALPQIMRLAGIRHFLTQKLSWNQFNKPASHTFLWEGLDGSRVLTHFPPADTYNSRVSVKELLYNVSNFKDHERANESMLLFGFGDGGGGPNLPMLERLNRLADVDGLPRLAVRPPREFFDRCAADIQDPLVWVGELYFELHRGTYTSQARNKQFNRQSELLLRDVELLSALAFTLHGSDYPSADLEKLWKIVLTNQFHDIIPGSSISEVYLDSTKDYEFILERARALRAKALRSLAPPGSGANKVMVFNTLSTPRTEVVELPEGIPGAQVSAAGGALGVVSVPALGYAIQTPAAAADAVSVIETADGFNLENSRLKAVFNRQGGLTSLFDKSARRESIEPGQAGNTFILYEDEPNDFDAWDVDIFHLEKKLALGGVKSAGIVESGPLRAALEFEFSISAASSLKQVVSLSVPAARLDFSCDVDWREKHRFLKVEFPLNVRAQQATYEIQFGHLQRPTHFNTSYDLARFEVPAQKWADLSEPDFGVALLNDCKYGYAAHGNILRLSLLRAPLSPAPDADQGRHQFRFAVYPHAGSPQSAGVMEEAYRFNVPVLTVKSGAADCRHSFFAVDNPALVVDTVKKAEDGDGIIVRLYESRGTRGTARLTTPLPFRSAALVNLLEQEISTLPWQNGGMELSFRPFEIVSLRLER